MEVSKLEIKQKNGEQGIFTEVYIDGHKIHGVRSYELKHEHGNTIPTLTLDLNALDMTVDAEVLRLDVKGMGDVESIKFADNESPITFA